MVSRFRAFRAFAIIFPLAAVGHCAEIAPGKAVSIDGQSGEWDSGSRFFPFVMRDESGYRMYYSAGPRAEMGPSAWYPWNIGLATSKDGVGWSYRKDVREPVLYSTPFREGDLLNPDDIAKRFDSVYAIGPCVILSSSKDGSIYKMWYTGWAGEQSADRDGITTKLNYRIGHATSPDGVNWTKRPGKAGAGSVVGLGRPGEPDSKGAGQPWVLKEGADYRMWYEGFDGKTWRICCAESRDGENWDKLGAALGLGEMGELDELGARNPVVVRRKGQYELWYQGESASEPKYHTLRATSPDSTAWTKLPGDVTLHTDPPVTESEGIYVDSVIVEADGSCRVFFARESVTPRAVTIGEVPNSRWSIHTEVVNP